MKTLEDQNKQQFRQIGKLEGAVNTLTSLFRDIFQNTNQHDSMEPIKTADKQKTTASVCVIPTSNKFAPLDLTESNPHQSSLVDKDQVTESPNLTRKVSQEPLNSEEPTSFSIGTSDSILNANAKPYFHTAGSQSFSQSINNLPTAVP